MTCSFHNILGYCNVLIGCYVLIDFSKDDEQLQQMTDFVKKGAVAGP